MREINNSVGNEINLSNESNSITSNNGPVSDTTTTCTQNGVCTSCDPFGRCTVNKNIKFIHGSSNDNSEAQDIGKNIGILIGVIFGLLLLMMIYAKRKKIGNKLFKIKKIFLKKLH
jgi:hypothetical protein